MAHLKFHKVTSLPLNNFDPSAVYLVQSVNAELLDIYVSNAAGNEVRSVLRQEQVLAMIEAKFNAMQPVIHNQQVPSALWVITHSFDYKPDVTIIDSAGDMVFGDVTYPTPTTVNIAFSAAFSGEATLS